MAIDNGSRIKEARVAAGLSQKALAEAVEGVTATDISKAERGIKELSPEQLASIKKVLKMDEEAQAPLTDAEKELLELYRSADDGRQQIVMFMLQGGKLDPTFIAMLPELIKGIDSAELLTSAKEFLLGANVGELLGYLNNFIDFKKVGNSIGQFRNQFGSTEQTVPADDAAVGNCAPWGGKGFSTSLLAFTYFYSSSIYILLLSFYFWLCRTDIKPNR